MLTDLTPGIRSEDRFVSAFEMADGHTLNGNPRAIAPLRKSAIEAFRQMGFPSLKNEAWKYTNIEKALRHDYKLLLAPIDHTLTDTDVDGELIADLDAHIVVLVNGRIERSLSRIGELPGGIQLIGLAEAGDKQHEVVERHLGKYADASKDALVALNTAFAQDGIFVHADRGAMLEKPIHLIRFTTTPVDAILQPRNLIVAEEGSSIHIIDTDEVRTSARTMMNAVTEVFVGRKANVRYAKIQNEGETNSQINTVHVHQKDDSVFSTTTLTLGGEVVRNNLTIVADGEHCESNLYGLVLGNGKMHVDNHTLMDHAMPNCESNELYKHVLRDQATAVFNGKVFVRRDAQKTNAYQSNKSIILDESARMFSKPELEIYADDVKCSHGATTGQLDAEAVFYLRSRGLSELQARTVLLYAFSKDVVETIQAEPLKEKMDTLIASRFGS
jgi:Fe-S cluster assembly protein SufD